jgi:hypothetical protein
MKTKKLIIGLVSLLLLVVVLSMSTKSQKMEEQPKFEIVEIGNGGAPKWSPDGTRLAFMSGGWLCVADADGKEEIKRVAEIRMNSLEWMSDSEFVFSEKEPWSLKGKGRGVKFRIKTVDLKGNIELITEDSLAPDNRYVSYISTPFVLKDGTVGYYEIHGKPEGETKVFKIIEEGKLKPEASGKQIHLAGEGLESIDGTIKKKINYDRKYYYVRLSPDETKILAHHYGLGIAVLDTTGNRITDFSTELPKVEPGIIADMVSASWSPDSKRIAYDLIVESEDTTYSREIYIANFDGSDKIKIPDIPGELIGGPAWSPDGTRIVCRSHSGRIFVIKVK